MEKQTFESLNLNEALIKGVYLYGFNKPSAIQIKGIESINSGKDCLLQSQSGTGKTATYLLGLLNRLEENDKTQALIIAPTRELGDQIFTVAKALSNFTNLTMEKCVGGTNINDNKQKLKKTNLIIGTLGRIHHMIIEKIIHLHSMKILVMDEADELLSDGVNEKLNFVIDKLPTGIQTILISATMNPNVFNLSKKILHDPIKILLKNSEVVVDLITQFYVDVESEDGKFGTLMDLYNIFSASQVIIFCNEVKTVNGVKKELEENNFTITCLHAKMPQSERDSTMKDFRDCKTRILLTTDILSRGIDIPQVNLVVNYDLPQNKETYIHRIGRCGRFGKKGVSISMVKSGDQSDMKTLEMMKQKYRIDIKEMPSNIDEYIS